MARGERRQGLGSSRRRLVHVAAATAVAAAGISSTCAPESTSQRQPNHAAREAALDHHRPAVRSAGTFRLPEAPLMHCLVRLLDLRITPYPPGEHRVIA